MRNKKFDLFKSWGLTEEEREKLEQVESAQKKFDDQKAVVSATIRSPGFNLIIELMVAEIEYDKERLVRARKKDVEEIQNKIDARKKFLDLWSPFMG